MRPEMIKSTALFGLLALVVVVIGAIILVRAHTTEQPFSLEADNHGPASPANAHMQNEAETPTKEDAKPDERPAHGGETAAATESSGVSQREWLILCKSRLQGEIEEYIRLVKSEPSASRKINLKLDKLIRNTIVEGFKQGIEFEVLKEELQSIVKWQPLPDEIRIPGTDPLTSEILGFEPGWVELPNDEVLTPVVLYDEVSLEDGAHLYVFQNATVGNEGGSFRRLRWDIYALFSQSDADPWELRLSGYYEDKVPTGIGVGQFLVDAFIDSLGVPRVAMVKGPEGNGYFVRVYLASIDAEGRDWSLLFPIETSEVYFWNYDAHTTLLEITVFGTNDDLLSNRYNLRNIQEK